MSATPILVVEDDSTLARSIIRNLTVRHYAVKGATTVAEAVAVLHETQPILVLLDIDLPDGSGWDVLRELRSTSYGAKVPVIVMSALRPNRRLFDELQATGVLEKPFPMESCLRLVAEGIGRGSEQSAERASGDG